MVTLFCTGSKQITQGACLSFSAWGRPEPKALSAEPPLIPHKPRTPPAAGFLVSHASNQKCPSLDHSCKVTVLEGMLEKKTAFYQTILSQMNHSHSTLRRLQP